MRWTGMIYGVTAVVSVATAASAQAGGEALEVQTHLRSGQVAVSATPCQGWTPLDGCRHWAALSKLPGRPAPSDVEVRRADVGERTLDVSVVTGASGQTSARAHAPAAEPAVDLVCDRFRLIVCERMRVKGDQMLADTLQGLFEEPK